jgi:hypothetical protein
MLLAKPRKEFNQEAIGRTQRSTRMTTKNFERNEFARELANAEAVGASKMTNEDLLRFCRSAYNFFDHHYLVDSQPFFRELWHRIEDGRISLTKTEACKSIGCSLRWGERIVDGSARDSRRAKGETAELESGPALAQCSIPEFVRNVTRYAEKKMRPLFARGERDRCRHIYLLAADYFVRAANVAHIDELRWTTAQENGGFAR